ARRQARVELEREETQQIARDSRIRGECPLHVGLAERDAGLQQVAAIGTQHGDLTRRQVRAEQQAVEAVVLDLRAPDGDEALAKLQLDAFDVDARAVTMLELEV